MKKLSIVFAFMIFALAGCIQLPPPDDITPPPVTSPAVSDSAAPSAAETQVPEPTVSVTPAETPAATEPLSPPVVRNRVLSNHNEYINADIYCPEISGMLDEALQQEINDSVYNELKSKADEIEQAATENSDFPLTYYINSKFTVRRSDGLFLSISEEIQSFSGGATSDAEFKFINIMNTAPGKLLTLGDLFLPGIDYTGIIEGRIRDMIQENPEKDDFYFQSINETPKFYLTGSSLVIAFNAYEIAPGTSGPQEFSIPLADIGDSLIPELK